MKRDLPPYVYRKAGGWLAFERRGHKTSMIRSEFGTPAFWAEYAKLLEGSEPATRSSYTFRALVASYRKSDRYTRLASRTVADYDKVLAFILKNYGDLDPRKMRRKDVIRARDAVAETIRFANYVVQVIRIIMEHAHDLGWIVLNPAEGVGLLKSDAPERQPWPVEKVKAFRDATAPTDRARLIFELCLGTGQRIGDVLKMRWSDVKDGGISIEQGKTKAKLWIPFTRQLRETLAVTPKRALFIVSYGPRPVSYHQANYAILQVRKAIGALDYDIHGLRYTTATELAEAGASDEIIMAVTGHKTGAMVHKYAAKARQESRARKAQAMRDDA